MRKKGANPDRLLARIARRQHGVVILPQLIAAGLSPAGITRRVQMGRLHRVYRGVYAVGHSALSNEGRWMAAVLACGDGAALSHRSAAELWEMLKPRSGAVHVTIPSTNGRRKRAGIRLHRSRYLTNRVTTRRNGVAVTTAARTIADLRKVASTDELHRAIREAEFLRLPIGGGGGDERDRSELERRFMRLCRRHRLPPPEVRVRVGPYEVDFLWRERRLIVEVDGWQSHGTRSAFETDRARDAHLATLGYHVIRFTWRQVIDEAAAVAATVRSLMARRLP